MKKFILGFIAGAMIFSVTRIDASNVLEVVQFPAKLLINGEPTPLIILGMMELRKWFVPRLLVQMEQ